jgi:hypothetical protein
MDLKEVGCENGTHIDLVQDVLNDEHLHCILYLSILLHYYTFAYDNTVPSQCNYLLFFSFTFPFHNMFRHQPATIRCFTLPKLLYSIECHSFTSHIL